MRRCFLPLSALILALAACQQAPAGDNAAAPANATATPAGLSDLQQRVVGLSQGQRDAVLFRAIRDGDAPCQGVAEAHRQEDVDGNPVYAAVCTDGPAYAIAIGRDGVAQVTRVSPDRR